MRRFARGQASGGVRLLGGSVASGDFGDALSYGRERGSDAVDDGVRVQRAAGEHVERDEPSFGPRVEARVGFGEQHDASYALGLELVEARGQNRRARVAAGLGQQRFPHRDTAQRLGIGDPEVGQQVVTSGGLIGVHAGPWRGRGFLGIPPALLPFGLKAVPLVKGDNHTALVSAESPQGPDLGYPDVGQIQPPSQARWIEGVVRRQRPGVRQRPLAPEAW